MRKLKAAAVFCVFLCLALLIMLGIPPRVARAQQQEDKSTAEAILRQLFASLAPVPEGDCQEDPLLRTLYDEKNRRYFSAKLTTHIVVCWDPVLVPASLLGYTEQKSDGSLRIRLSPSLQDVGNLYEIVLLHEMAHVSMVSRGVWEAHGKEFHKEMRRLARAGAFDELW